MKKLFVILSLIGCLSLNAQTPFLYVTKHNMIIEANSQDTGKDCCMHFPAEMNKDAMGRFNILSNVDWRIDCSQPWLTVTVQMFTIKDGQGWVYNPHSGTAPDIGAYEFMESYATGSDTAFVLLVAEPNGGVPRTAVVTVSGTNATAQTIVVTQTGVLTPSPTEPPREPNMMLIAKH